MIVNKYDEALDSVFARIPSGFVSVLRERGFEAVNHIDMLITEDCNCRCDYCFVEGKREVIAKLEAEGLA